MKTIEATKIGSNKKLNFVIIEDKGLALSENGLFYNIITDNENKTEECYYLDEDNIFFNYEEKLHSEVISIDEDLKTKVSSSELNEMISATLSVCFEESKKIETILEDCQFIVEDALRNL
jgi:hypothetical protein